MWADAVSDYGRLRKLLPGDKEVAEAMFHAQVALKKSRGEEVSNLSFGGEVEKISGPEHLRDAVSSLPGKFFISVNFSLSKVEGLTSVGCLLSGVVLVHFMSSLNEPCLQIAQFVDGLCTRYPLVNFLRVMSLRRRKSSCSREFIKNRLKFFVGLIRWTWTRAPIWLGQRT